MVVGVVSQEMCGRDFVREVEGEKKNPADVRNDVGGAEGRKMLLAGLMHIQTGNTLFGKNANCSPKNEASC